MEWRLRKIWESTAPIEGRSGVGEDVRHGGDRNLREDGLQVEQGDHGQKKD